VLDLGRNIDNVQRDLASMKTRKFTLVPIFTILSALFTINSAPGQTWTQTSAPSNYWQSVATSADGANLVALVNPGTIYISTNSGTSWIGVVDLQLSHVIWQSVASSADGSKLLVAPQSGWPYISTNFGATWLRQTNLPPSNWSRVGISGDGNKLFAFSQYMYLSSDSGATWTTNDLPYQYGGGAAVSADGNTIAFARSGYPALIYCSTNNGATWVTNSMPFYIMGIAPSADGKKLAVACLDGGIFTSTNSGSTWSVTSAPNIPWRAIASSADGNVLVATENYGSAGSIYTSTNAGLSWVSNDVASLHWNSLAASADGSKFFATAAEPSSSVGPIYRFAATPAVGLTLQSLSGSGILSWTISSQPYTVEQSADLSNWAKVAGSPAVDFNISRNELAVPLTGEKNFFRLRFE
jgi:photosystem II stability/assembly factor-like uncharacterized protein